jgi:hypothetical protein
MPDLKPGYNLIRMRLGGQTAIVRHCEPTGRANARLMTGSVKQSIEQ